MQNYGPNGFEKWLHYQIMEEIANVNLKQVFLLLNIYVNCKLTDACYNFEYKVFDDIVICIFNLRYIFHNNVIIQILLSEYIIHFKSRVKSTFVDVLRSYMRIDQAKLDMHHQLPSI